MYMFVLLEVKWYNIILNKLLHLSASIYKRNNIKKDKTAIMLNWAHHSDVTRVTEPRKKKVIISSLYYEIMGMVL